MIAVGLVLIMNIGILAFAEDGNESTSFTEGVENPSESGTHGTQSGEESPPNDENSAIGSENTSESGALDSESGEKISTDADGKNTDKNIFEESYKLLEDNADKIFSVLAFIGTLVVGIGYKSGLLPLLREALSKLKASLDGVKAEGERNMEMTTEMFTELVDAVENINLSLRDNAEELNRIGWQFDDYQKFCKERESMRLVMLGQIDMLYAIFMSSSLPQYQKDEIGEKIGSMREELRCYESEREN